MSGYERTTAERRFPWYSMNPRAVRLRSALPLTLMIVALFCMSEKHLWRLDWYGGLHARYNCRQVADAHGQQREAWRWVEGREIRIYAPLDMPANRVEDIATGVRGLVRELQLDMTVRVLPTDGRIRHTLERNSIDVGHDAHLQVNAFCRDLVGTRRGHFAEIIITPETFDGQQDTLGLAFFTYGVSLLNAQCANGFLARHETGHLLGYHQHDNWPFIVFGYSDPHIGKILQRHTSPNPSLMMPVLQGDKLSAQSRDALISFWRGLERRTGQAFFLR